MKAFKFADIDTVVANSLEEAKEHYKTMTGEEEFKDCEDFDWIEELDIDIYTIGYELAEYNFKDVMDYLGERYIDDVFNLKYHKSEGLWMIQLTLKQVIDLEKIVEPEIIASSEY